MDGNDKFAQKNRERERASERTNERRTKCKAVGIEYGNMKIAGGLSACNNNNRIDVENDKIVISIDAQRTKPNEDQVL